MTTEHWKPKGIDDLEPVAWTVLKCGKNACVVAGPGAGKTEFLAQKVAFALENNLCAAPKRILAISFKKDAADNLAERVRDRCFEKHSARFDSVTFDAFTKSLVDRFSLALPESWRPKPEYEIVNFSDKQIFGFLNDMRRNLPQHANQIDAIPARVFQHELLGTHKITVGTPKQLTPYLCQKWLSSCVRNNLDFLAINRLAEFILRNNNYIAKALSLTYTHVLVDEFQDTTFSQYAFLQTLLKSLNAEITVVGDNKQRIMVWAGAKPDSFVQFSTDFSAKQFELQMNFRSSPGLVRIHHFLARSIDSQCAPAKSAVKQIVAKDVAQIWNFQDASKEFSYLADWIKQDMNTRNLSPSDYALLVRQKPDEVHSALSKVFLKKGMTVCNEVQKFGKLSLQDVVSDDLFVFLSSLFRISITTGASVAWSNASQCLEYFFHTDREEQDHKLRKFLERLVERKLSPKLMDYSDPENSIEFCLDAVLTAIGKDAIRGAFPQHHSESNFAMFLEATTAYLKFCADQSISWIDFIDRVDRVGQIPLLTVHKSKGLEYDTVIFMGLDDSAWWSYSNQNPEGKATFFVGLSRAKQRVIFTYARGSGGRNKISELYQLLAAAGVPERSIT